MNRSLQRHLSLMLGSARSCSPAWWRPSPHLRSLFRSQGIPGRHAAQDRGAEPRRVARVAGKGTAKLAKITLKDPESRITIIHLPGDERPDWLAADLRTVAFTPYTRAPSDSGCSSGRPQGDARSSRSRPTRVTKSRPTVHCTPDSLVAATSVLTLLIVRVVRHELAPIASFPGVSTSKARGSAASPRR
jgi:hypothetical protein